MPTYEVVKPWNHEIKAGERIEVETLHPSLKAHVKLVSGSVKDLVKSAQSEKTEKTASKSPADNKPAKELTTAEKRQAALEQKRKAEAEAAEASELTAEQLDALHEEALAEDAERTAE